MHCPRRRLLHSHQPSPSSPLPRPPPSPQAGLRVQHLQRRVASSLASQQRSAALLLSRIEEEAEACGERQAQVRRMRATSEGWGEAVREARERVQGMRGKGRLTLAEEEMLALMSEWGGQGGGVMRCNVVWYDVM